jgi:hypothetical protein
LKTYREWITGSLLSNDAESDLSGIVVLPVLSTKPDYRDVLSGPFQARLGVDTITFGSWLGIPELVLPGKAWLEVEITSALTKMHSGQNPLPFEDHGAY